MPCSAVTLSLATICAVISVALLAIAFSTDNWLRIDVKRDKLKSRLDESSSITPTELETKELYFTRTKGLFRVCFPNERPSKTPLYLSPVETYCRNIGYYIPDDNDVVSEFSNDEVIKLHMSRGMIALFILSFLFVFIAFWTGVSGCWRRSSGNITSTAILMLVACLLSSGGMGLWHGVEYYETEKLTGDQYYKDWPNELKSSSTLSLDWSFYISWLSVGFSLISAILFATAASCLYKENDNMYQQQQYLMTVHPSKQGGYAYAPAAGYGHGYVAAYPPMGHGQVAAGSYPYSY